MDDTEHLVEDIEEVQENWSKFLKPTDITSGNAKLNLAYVANLFNLCPGLEELEEEELEGMEDWMFSGEGFFFLLFYPLSPPPFFFLKKKQNR